MYVNRFNKCINEFWGVARALYMKGIRVLHPDSIVHCSVSNCLTQNTRKPGYSDFIANSVV